MWMDEWIIWRFILLGCKGVFEVRRFFIVLSFFFVVVSFSLFVLVIVGMVIGWGGFNMVVIFVK